MRNNRRDVVADVADAVTLNQDVQWNRCARLAAPAERRLLDNLGVLAQVFASGRAAGDREAISTATSRVPQAGVFVRRVLRALVAVAAVEVVAALMLLPWMWDDYHRAHGDVAVYMATLLGGHGASAALLLFAGRRDRRRAAVGRLLSLQRHARTAAHAPGVPGARAAARDVAGVGLGHARADPDLPAPLRIPAGVRDTTSVPVGVRQRVSPCPSAHRLDDLARRMVPISVAIGGAMCAGMASVYVAGWSTTRSAERSTWRFSMQPTPPVRSCRWPRSSSSHCARTRRRPPRCGVSSCSVSGC